MSKTFIRITEESSGYVTVTDDFYYFEESGIRFLDENGVGEDFAGNRYIISFFVAEELPTQNVATMSNREKVRDLFNALSEAIDEHGIKPADKAAILNTAFCICKCGTPLFVWRVTEFPKGYTTVYCPDCLSEKVIANE